MVSRHLTDGCFSCRDDVAFDSRITGDEGEGDEKDDFESVIQQDSPFYLTVDKFHNKCVLLESRLNGK